jgi:hypothetical protein
VRAADIIKYVEVSFMSIVLCLAGIIGCADLDAVSKTQLEIAEAAARAARSAHTGFAANIEYTVKCKVHVPYVRPESVRGEVRWDGRRVRYTWFNADKPDRLEVCAVRDGARFVRAERYNDGSVQDLVTFELRPALATAGAIQTERLSIGDPARWFCGCTLDAVREGLVAGNLVDPTMRDEGEYIVLRSRLKIGPTFMVRFNANTGYLADRLEKVDDSSGKPLLSEETYTWAQQDGKWVLQKAEWIDRWFDAPTKKAAEAHKLLTFSNIRVNEKFTDKDFSPDELPIPLGSPGLDKRVLPFAGLIRDVAEIALRSEASSEAHAAMKQAIPAADDPKGAVDAAAERSGYRWSMAAKACAILAAAAVGALLLLRFRARATGY